MMKRHFACLILLMAAICLAGCQDEQRVRNALIDMGYIAGSETPAPTPEPSPTPGPTPRIARIEDVIDIGQEPVEAQSVSLNRNTLSLKVGKSARLKAVVLPKNASDKSVRFESDDPAICTVGPKGKVRAIAPGTAIISCLTNNGLSDKCAVTVRAG